MQCSFYVRTYWSESGYQQKWEVTGQRATIGPTYATLTVNPGDYILRVVYESDRDETLLFRVPQDPAQFETFKQEAERVAGKAVYERVAPIFDKRRWSHAEAQLLRESNLDLDGSWLTPYLLKAWRNDFGKAELIEIPHSLEQALQMST